MLKYQQRLELINTWLQIVDYHWHRLKGQMHNDSAMWDDTLHSMTADDWWAWVDIEPAVRVEFQELYDRYPKLSQDTEWIKKRLQLGKPITHKMAKGQNFTAFRCLMAMHDLFNDIKGTPTRQYDQESEPEPETQFERLFDV